ncbi:hypothetical protein T11_11050 [Trichinella zimbabwensis]|uniref:Uncharacterized protein n=1 Tax=Trichinella zimbabwensis TaxID=268475 RepID=A0A0V1HFF9_9BILA|nr:hypothetical protein T11_11050 [Trichinella zimbabwensis]
MEILNKILTTTLIFDFTLVHHKTKVPAHGMLSILLYFSVPIILMGNFELNFIAVHTYIILFDFYNCGACFAFERIELHALKNVEIEILCHALLLHDSSG